MKTMVTKKINLLIFLLLIIGLGGCWQKDSPPAEDPDIIGKWELVAEGPNEDKIAPVEANESYWEFLPNGEHKGYGADAKYTYQTDGVFLYLYYLDNSDGVNDRIYEYTIISRDTLKLKYVRGIMLDRPNEPFIFIYQRIK
jgi:hypothetical protein